MKVFRGLPNAASRAPCALAIGNFDGVHLGHQALLARVCEAAARLQLDAAVMTFEPHPREFFASIQGDPSRAPSRIANLRDKLQALATTGIERVIVEHFNAHFASLAPQDFVEKVLVQGLHAKWLIVGEDFCYGAKRAGNLATLVESGRKYGFEVEVLRTVTNDGTRISSSAVRAALTAADFDHARQLLGQSYAISGHVIHGKKLGRTLGFPTLNLRVTHKHPVLNGIFIVQVHGLAETPLPGVASLGLRPTVDDSGRVLLETHVFDFAQQCYGKLIRVEFLKKLRDEEKYSDLPTLIDAIAHDAAQARAYFKHHAEAPTTATERI
ncbi:MAG: bifunctional riboflavin kinase/FAD synthetase [Glaciimonas sp.]|nr:bifunctional riboflavin kinase/FAD synthetase [Glaciimonas sp.]